MEKSGITGKRYVRLGLLKYASLLCFLIVVFNSVCFSAPSPKELDAMEFVLTPDENGQTLFVQKEIHYELVIPDVASYNIQADLGELPKNAAYISSRKSHFIKDDKAAVKIEFWFKFTVPGSYILPDARITIQGKKFSVPFERALIHEDPRKIFPEMVIRFKAEDNANVRQENDIKIDRRSVPPSVSLPCGKKLEFTVYIKHAVRIIRFTWDLPRDSFFTELQQFEIINEKLQDSDSFSDEEIPVAVFEWEPLIEGVYSIPEISVSAVAYNGSTIDLSEPVYRLTAASFTRNKLPSEKKPNLYVNAFASAPSDLQKAEKESITPEDLKKITALRVKERHSFPFSRVEKERDLFERSLGITSSEKEPSYPLLIATLIFIFITVLLIIILFIIKKSRWAAVCVAVTFLSVAFLIYNGVKLSQTYGIVAAGNLSTIPEKGAAASVPLEKGIRVRVTEEVGEWLYIQNKKSGGWILRDNILFIR